MKLVLMIAIAALTIQTSAFASVTFAGTVSGVSPIWTGNGDGGIEVQGDDKASYSVAIVGSPARAPKQSTHIHLVSVKYLQDLVGKRVQVTGNETGPNSIEATVVQELIGTP